MVIFLSPAKRLDPGPVTDLPVSNPLFLDHARRIMETLRKKSPGQLQKLQGISKDLATMNWQRNQEWDEDGHASGYPAGLLFKGDVYVGLEAEKFSREDWLWAQDHLRILSGLYGCLRPLDRIQPYRLEMGTALPVARKANLYGYWKTRLQPLLDSIGNQPVINLASAEYFKAVQPLLPKEQVIQVNFLDWSNGSYKPVQLWVKKARGLMARSIISNRWTNPEQLPAFDEEGYRFAPDRSSNGQLVFIRDH